MIDRPKPTVDRARIEAMVRDALTRRDGAAAAEREMDTAGALLLTPHGGVSLRDPYAPPVMTRILASPPARVPVGRVGPRYHTNTMLRFRADHAAAKDAVLSEVDPELIARLGMFEVSSRAPDKATFLQRPDLGRTLSDEGRAELAKRIGRAPTLVIIYGDGLSAAALDAHLAEFHGSLERSLASRGIGHAPPFFVRRSRVKIMDEIAGRVGAEAALFVCGGRPGLGFADSMSAYYIYQPAAGATDADREVISNINPRCRPPADATRVAILATLTRRARPPADATGDVATAIERILREKKSGVILAR